MSDFKAGMHKIRFTLLLTRESADEAGSTNDGRRRGGVDGDGVLEVTAGRHPAQDRRLRPDLRHLETARTQRRLCARHTTTRPPRDRIDGPNPTAAPHLTAEALPLSCRDHFSDILLSGDFKL